MTAHPGGGQPASGGGDGPRPDETLTALPAARTAETVRFRLDRSGHGAVQFESGWIRLDPLPCGGVRPVAEVPIGRGHTLSLLGATSGRGDSGKGLVDAFARDLTAALPEIDAARRHLLRRLRAMAEATQAALRPRPGETRLLSNAFHSFAPIPAALLAGPNARATVLNATVVIDIAGLGADLKRVHHAFEVGQADEIAAALEPLRREQPERWRRLQLSLAPGPRIEVDAITVGLLAAAGLDPVQILRRFSQTWQFSLRVTWDGHDRTIYLTSKGTRIKSQMSLIDGAHRVYWSDYVLAVEKSRRKTKLAKPGAFASAIIGHPAFRDRTVVAVELDREPGSCVITLDEPLLSFDADTGTFRQLAS